QTRYGIGIRFQFHQNPEDSANQTGPNTNHDDCITKILNKVNSRAKVQSPKIKNNNPVEPKNHHTLLDLVLGGNQRVEFSRLLVLGGYLQERCSPIAQPKLTVNLQMVQMMISLTHMVTKKIDISYVRSSRNSNLMNMLQMMFELSSSSLGLLCQKMLGQNSLGLVLHLDDA
ncbi:hypothetical protein Tco_0160618, partial [Tanacetum coccineum]